MASANTGVVETRGLRRTLLMALAFLTHNGKLICAQSYVTLCTLPSSTSDPPLHAHGLGAAADWTWRGMLDLVCDGPGVYVGAVSGFTMKWYFSKTKENGRAYTRQRRIPCTI